MRLLSFSRGIEEIVIFLYQCYVRINLRIQNIFKKWSQLNLMLDWMCTAMEGKKSRTV